MKLALTLLAICVLAGLAWVRLAPSLPARWNTDPRQARVADNTGWVVLPAGGNETGRTYPLPPGTLMDEVAKVAAAWPRTRLVAREGLRATWVTRTKWIGFPDYTTVEAVPDGDGSRLLVHARQRYGSGDMGVNRLRVRTWLAALEAQL